MSCPGSTFDTGSIIIIITPVCQQLSDCMCLQAGLPSKVCKVAGTSWPQIVLLISNFKTIKSRYVKRNIVVCRGTSEADPMITNFIIKCDWQVFCKEVIFQMLWLIELSYG